MTDELSEDAKSALELFSSTRVIPPHLDRDGILREVRRRRRNRRVAMGGGAAAVGLAVLAFLGSGSVEITDAVKPSPVASVRSVQMGAQSRTPLRAGQRLGPKNVVVAEGGSVELELTSGRVLMEGPAEFSLAEGRVSVESGAGRITGTTELAGCGCEASVDGEATFVATTRALQIVVIAGAVHVAPQEVHCHVVELVEPEDHESESGRVDETAPTRPARSDVGAVHRSRARRTPDCDLGAQADAYREAMRLRSHDDERLVASLRQIRRDYRRCPLSHEVDVALIEALLRSGQTAAAQREARAFVRRYPRSARRAEMEHIVSPERR